MRTTAKQETELLWKFYNAFADFERAMDEIRKTSLKYEATQKALDRELELDAALAELEPVAIERGIPSWNPQKSKHQKRNR